MAKKGKFIWVMIFIIGVLALGMFIQKKTDLFATAATATLTRTLPSSVNPGSTFQVTYSTSTGITGNWFVAWSDIITGGCTPSSVNLFLTSGDPPVLTSDSKTVTFTAPSSGSCTFSNTGYYQFSGGVQTNFPTQIVTICTPTCNQPTDKCLTSSSNGCGGTCTWTITKNTPADTNCDTKVLFEELITYANSWASGSVTFSNLIQAANAWAGGS